MPSVLYLLNRLLFQIDEKKKCCAAEPIWIRFSTHEVTWLAKINVRFCLNSSWVGQFLSFFVYIVTKLQTLRNIFLFDDQFLCFDLVLGVLNKIKKMTYWNEIRYSYVYMELIRMCERIEWLVSVTSLSISLHESIHTNELYKFKLFPKNWQQSPNQIHLLKQSRVACSKPRTEVYSQRPNNQSVNIHFRWVWFVIKPFFSLALKTHSYCLCN